ncbi:MAG: hypothetical protein PHG02_05670 [Oscillospiraceae bacterium]|nr:hypothetical protein [Oscillospiraceae bacterium]
MASPRYTLNYNPDDDVTYTGNNNTSPLTKKQKWDNSWYYYKYHFLIGAVVILLASMFIKDIVTQRKPDYTVSIVSSRTYPEAFCEAIENALIPYADDYNGDGTVDVYVAQYILGLGENEVDYNQQMAGSTQLMADISSGTSFIYLCDDAAAFQKEIGVYSYLDSNYSLPAEGAQDYENMVKSWNDSPVLSSIDIYNLGLQENYGYTKESIDALVNSIQIGLRAYHGTDLEKKEKLTPYFEGSIALFEKIF